jgi:hypothetical protein
MSRPLAWATPIFSAEREITVFGCNLFVTNLSGRLLALSAGNHRLPLQTIIIMNSNGR